MNAPETAVIILNYNGLFCINDCINSVLKSDYKDFKIILIDNASSDTSLVSVKETFKREIELDKIFIYESYRNLGFAEGNNIGYLFARESKYVCLLNYDSIIPTNWLSLMVVTMNEHPTVGISGCSIEGNTQEEYAMTLLQEYGGKKRGLNYPVTFATIASGNGMMIRRSMVEIPFKNSYFAYAEDVDLCWNLLLRGIPIVWRKDAVLKHVGSTAKKQDKELSNLVTFHGIKNQIINYLVHYEKKNIIRIFPLFVVGQIAQLAYNPKTLFQRLKAYGWIFTHPIEIFYYRSELQHSRTVSDKAIIQQLSGIICVADSFTGIKKHLLNIVNNASLLYCKIVRLKTMELTK